MREAAAQLWDPVQGGCSSGEDVREHWLLA